RKVLMERFMFCPEWSRVQRRLTIWGSLTKTFGHCRTLLLGQAVDTCCQELNGTRPSSRDMRATGLGRAAYVTGVTNREREEQTLVHLPWFATVFLLAQLSLTVFEASGDRA
ncbi:hypothetical protein KUCAC02_003419, partial [Chaenocephalus aceratus]